MRHAMKMNPITIYCDALVLHMCYNPINGQHQQDVNLLENLLFLLEMLYQANQAIFKQKK
jgi:hypothetical protein